jgi:hypothetical protein
MRAAASRMTLKLPTVLTISVRVKISSGSGPSRPTVLPTVPMPAQFTTMRTTPPHFSWAASSSAVTSASLVTSVGKNSPCAPSSVATSAPGLRARSAMATLAPDAASRSAVARPKPEPPPVTSAINP